MLRGLLASAPMFACAFWFLALLLDYKHYNRAKKVFTAFMFVATIHFFCQAEFCSLEYELTGKIDPLYTFVTLSVFPLYYLYIKALTDPEKITVRSLWVFIPAITVTSFSVILYALMSPEETEAFVHEVLYNEPGNFRFTMAGKLQRYNIILMAIVFAAMIFPVAYYGSLKIVKYDKLLVDYFSNQEGKSLGSVKKILYAFVYTSIASAIFNAIGRYHFVEPIYMLWIASVFFVTMLFPLGLIGFRQDFTIDDFQKDIIKTSGNEITAKDISDRDNQFRMKQLEKELIALIENEELFKNPDLRITDLAIRMGSNRAYISRIINNNLQTNFSEMVNKYRIEHAKKMLLLSHSALISMPEIADASGFSSESSFYRIFKNAEGVSPKAWRSRHHPVNAL